MTGQLREELTIRRRRQKRDRRSDRQSIPLNPSIHQDFISLPISIPALVSVPMLIHRKAAVRLAPSISLPATVDIGLLCQLFKR